MREYAAATIPDAITAMNDKQQSVMHIVQWCELSYQQTDKREVMGTTKEYLADALQTITADLGDIAQHLTDFLDMQVGDAAELSPKPTSPRILGRIDRGFGHSPCQRMLAVRSRALRARGPPNGATVLA